MYGALWSPRTLIAAVKIILGGADAPSRPELNTSFQQWQRTLGLILPSVLVST